MYLVETLPVVLVLAGIRISHVSKAFRAEGWNVGEANFGTAGEDRVTDGEVARIVDSDNIPRVGNLKVRHVQEVLAMLVTANDEVFGYTVVVLYSVRLSYLSYSLARNYLHRFPLLGKQLLGM